MKTEVRHEHGDWAVFVDGNPRFIFWFREEAESVAEMIDALIQIYEAINTDFSNDYIFEDDLNENSHLGKITITVKDARGIIQALTKAGVQI